jgi:uncharacterized repeat protein (TIGR04076 family)
MYKVTVQVKEVRGNCALGYKPGDTLTTEKIYVKEAGRSDCLHAHHGRNAAPFSYIAFGLPQH